MLRLQCESYCQAAMPDCRSIEEDAAAGLYRIWGVPAQPF